MANQLRFVEMIIEELTANGVVVVARLYESPFTDQAPNGPDSLFTDDQIDGIVPVLDKVRTHALPDVTVACDHKRRTSRLFTVEFPPRTRLGSRTR